MLFLLRITTIIIMKKKDNYIQAVKYYYNGSKLTCLSVWFFVNPHIFHLKYGQLILIELLLYT